MECKMTEYEALQKRISCRAFEDRPLTDEERTALEECAAALDAAAKAADPALRIELFTPGPGEKKLAMSKAMFMGPVYTYAAVIGPGTPEAAEKLGYFGHKLVLFAEQLGLSTCWVAGTYSKSSLLVEKSEDERIWDIIPIGHSLEKQPLLQRGIRKKLRGGDRPLASFVEAEAPLEELPKWFQRAVEAVKIGPSAVNGQPINFSWEAGDGTPVVRAIVAKENHNLEYNDLGIAKYQFEAAARAFGVEGSWEWGDGGRFMIKSE